MSTSLANQNIGSNLLAAILSDESFRPSEPTSISDTGLPVSLVESLIIKRLAIVGMNSGRQIANDIKLPFPVIESILRVQRERRFIVHNASAPLIDYNYT